MKRHPELSARTPEHLGHQRKQVTEHSLRQWFVDLENFLLEEHGIVARDFLVEENNGRIFNLDETGFPLCGSNKLKVISERGSKNVYNVATESKEQITVLGCVSARGQFQKPYVLFPGVRPTFNFQNVDPSKFTVGVTPNGWISSETFFAWFSNQFIPAVKETHVAFPIIVFMDGHSSHINLAMSEFCRNNNIILYCFPPHASHIIQPLDIAVYGPLKKSWNRAINNFKEKYSALMNKSNFFTVFDEAWEEAKNKPENVISGFRKAGLIPFNPNALDFSRLIDVKSAAQKFQNNSSFASTEQKLGIHMSLQLFQKHLSKTNLQLFEKRYGEGYNINNNTDLCQMYQVYRSIRMLIETEEFNINDPGIPIQNEESISLSPKTRTSSPAHEITLPDIDFSPSTSESQPFIELQLLDSSLSNANIISPANTDLPTVATLTPAIPYLLSPSFVPAAAPPDNIPESSVACSAIQGPSTSYVTQMADDPGEGTSYQHKQYASSNPKFYGKVSVSPFKKYIKMDENILNTKKDPKRKVSAFLAVSGDECFEYLKKKQENKIAEQVKKELRQKERLQKRKEKEDKIKQKKTYTKPTNSDTDEEDGREGEVTVVYNDNSDEDIILGANDECAACGGDDRKDDPTAWIGCVSCPLWYHTYCLNMGYETMTMAELAKVDFKCNLCMKSKNRFNKKI